MNEYRIKVVLNTEKTIGSRGKWESIVQILDGDDYWYQIHWTRFTAKTPEAALALGEAYLAERYKKDNHAKWVESQTKIYEYEWDEEKGLTYKTV